ncbi:MAG: glutaredoxin family protein [Sinobacteraceae bacterium]|nr:glutaredoxin family protein [Nevskiaceae bacterium]
MNAPHRLLLLSRPGCGLCHEMAEALDVHFGSGVFQLEWVNIDEHEDWCQRWGLLIPVLLAEDGTPLSVTRLDAQQLTDKLGVPVRPPRTR